MIQKRQLANLVITLECEKKFEDKLTVTSSSTDKKNLLGCAGAQTNARDNGYVKPSIDYRDGDNLKS